MLKLIDPEATIKFIPSCEQGSENPTTFFIKPETMRAKLKRQRLFNYNVDTKQVDFADDDRWLDYISERVSKIINLDPNSRDVSPSGDPRPSMPVREILIRLPANVGAELFNFIMENTDLGEAESKK